MIEITRKGAIPTVDGPEGYFSGNVKVTPLVNAPEPARTSSAKVAFEAGARTAWHAHPLGQTLIVLSGVGSIQSEGQPIQEIREGDAVWIPPNIKHWHGASPDSAMTHIAIQEAQNGSPADWMELVSDEDYLGSNS